MLILTLHKKFAFDNMFSLTKDSHQPNEVKKRLKGNAQDFTKFKLVVSESESWLECIVQFLFITGQIIIPEICNKKAKTVKKKARR